MHKAPKASVWHPYNVEAAEEDEDEVDDTQEIQIEEALKLYQTALKYHSEGPESFEKTAAAYKALFESDIFKYTESLSEFRRHEVFGDTLVFDSILEEDFEVGPAQAAGAADSAPNTLPQILHLSYKNHGQFLLESMQFWISQHGAIAQTEGWINLRASLNYFAEALDKEDTDLDLWLRTASVSAMMGSKRLTRFCLESILDGNDEQWESLLQLPGLEEGFAGQQLRDFVERLEDNVSLMQAPLSSMKRKKLSEKLKNRLNPFPFAPLPADVASVDQQFIGKSTPGSIELTPAKWDWASVGEAILQHYMAEQRGLAFHAPGSNITIKILEDSETPPRAISELEDTVADLATANSKQPGPQQISDPTMALDSEQQMDRNGDDVVIDDQESPDIKNEGAPPAPPSDTVAPPSRKRSTDSAGLPETAEGGRSRSKRIRGRESIIEPSASGGRVAQDGIKLLEEQLEPFTHADECLYEIVKDIYSRLGVEGIKQPAELRSLLTADPVAIPADPIDKAACNVYKALQSGNSKTAQILLSGESFDLVGVTRDAGLNAFLGFAKSSSGQACVKPILENQKLGAFARSVNQGWLSSKEAAFEWVEVLLSLDAFSTSQGNASTSQPSYLQFRWAEDLKRNLVQIIVNMDDYIYERMFSRIDDLNRRILSAFSQSQTYALTDFEASQIEIVQTLFELHLDVYSLIKHPHSQVDGTTQTLQSDRLERWSTLARDVIQLRSDCLPDIGTDDLALRHIWASVFQMSVNDEVVPEHVVNAMAELKRIFQSSEERAIQIQNNAIMPELSIAAIDRELVRISMKDFFLKVFDQDEKDPVAVIESLEPILEQDNPTGGTPDPEAAVTHQQQDQPDARSSPTVANEGTKSPSEIAIERPSPVLEMRKFLDGANVNVRLSLWHRLREAYEAIEYPPKVLSCFLRSIETLVADFKSTNFDDLSTPEQQIKIFTRFRVIDDMVVKVIRLIRDETSAFECLSYEHVQSSMSAIAELLHILSAANMFRDTVRVNHIPIPRLEGLTNSTFMNMFIKLDDLHLRLWMLQYYLLREGISQNLQEFPTPSEDLFEFIRHVHHATGVRGFCHLSGRQFLRLTKDELLRMDDVVDGASHDTELCQVLNDLYGLKLFIEPLDCQDFLTTPDALDKKTAFSLLSFVMSQTAKVDLKDLPKTELRGAIEKVHAALGRPKQNEDITFNRKIITSYFKSPVNPVSLFNCLKGVGSLPTKMIGADEAVAASKGWYYLMGNIALSKFRSAKRMTQGPTEELNYAQAFFMQDLEFSAERWETWFRLAQANDTQLEEAVSWNADKMNNNSSVELVNFQRAAINCYVMAVACAVRDADATPQTLSKVAQMYTEFGNRMYASSREPFSMEAFQVREAEKRFCNNQNQTGTYKDVSFVPLQTFTAWKFAGTLFKRAIKGHPNKWWNHYMLGKCQWKMWSACDHELHYNMSIGAPPPPQRGPTWEQVIDGIVSAIENLPGKKGRNGEPILEPHYKLISIVHKLFQRKAIDRKKGVEILAHTCYAQNVNGPEGSDDWERFVLAVLKALRTADKTSWHHRVIARSAHIIFDGSKDKKVALDAKHELTQQIFTKTMAVQVWKPENERPGRHFVYTTRYTKFFIELLDLTEDKANYEALAKRVRRKQSDFFEHQKLWQEMCARYIKLLRRTGKIADGQEDSAFKSVNHEEFNILALRLEAWCQNPTTQHPMLDILRDAIEFKRLNNSLMKPLLIDDLIGDTYALLYTVIGPTLPPLPSEQPPQPQPQPHAPLQPLGQSLAPSAPTPGMPISSLMHVQMDGTVDPNTNSLFNRFPPNPLQPQQALPQAPVPPQPEPAKPRAKAVGRREIARRAEACVQRPANTGPHPTSMPIRSPPILNATFASLNRTSSPEKSSNPKPSTEHLHRAFDRSGTATAAASVNNDDMDRSAPASDHDDADDESELSELDDDEVQEIEQEVVAGRPPVPSIATIKSSAMSLFPNLMEARLGAEKREGEGEETGEDTEMGEGGK